MRRAIAASFGVPVILVETGGWAASASKSVASLESADRAGARAHAAARRPVRIERSDGTAIGRCAIIRASSRPSRRKIRPSASRRSGQVSPRNALHRSATASRGRTIRREGSCRRRLVGGAADPRPHRVTTYQRHGLRSTGAAAPPHPRRGPVGVELPGPSPSRRRRVLSRRRLLAREDAEMAAVVERALSRTASGCARDSVARAGTATRSPCD